MTVSAEERRRTKERLEEQIKANGRGPLREAVTLQASQVAPEKIEWLWPGRLALGKITLLEGDPGLGKSTLTLEMAARLSMGKPLPGGLILKPTGTLLLSAEDGVADTIVPRLMAAGANLGLVHIMEGIRTHEGEAGVQIPTDLDLIEEAMTLLGCSLVVMDPLSVFLGDDISENRNQEVRKALAPAKAMFERARVSGLLLRHLTKSQSANPVYRGAGSIGLGGAARIVMMVAEDPEIPGLRILAEVKNNLSKPAPSLSYRLISSPLDPDVGQIEWSGESRWAAKDLQAPHEEEEFGPKLGDAVEWLKEYLHGGVTVMVKQMQRDATAAGISEKTLKRARKAVGVVPTKDGHGAWGARLPDPLPQEGHRATEQEGQSPRTRTNPDPLDPLSKNNVDTTNNTYISMAPLLAPLQEGLGPLPRRPTGSTGPGVYEMAPWEDPDG